MKFFEPTRRSFLSFYTAIVVTEMRVFVFNEVFVRELVRPFATLFYTDHFRFKCRYNALKYSTVVEHETTLR